jgi:hypothetical protein
MRRRVVGGVAEAVGVERGGVGCVCWLGSLGLVDPAGRYPFR